MTNVPVLSKVSCKIEDLQPGDVIYISNKPDAVPFTVLDVGSPFILIENMKSHFANLYRPTVIYKEVVHKIQ